ncbi:MAG: glycosyltransferase family 4 protein [Patescibacteria group bacterium]
MKILLINKFYYLKGGAEKHFFELKEMLERHGHEVVVFSMRDEKNIPSAYSKYFVSNVNFENVTLNWQGLRTAGRMLYSFEARRKISRLLDAEKPDLVHVHNIYHQISPSILSAIKKRNIPIVQTLHDYKLLSPNYALFCHGKICECAFGGAYYKCIRHRCIKDSTVASTLSALEMYLHKSLQLYEKNVDVFICPSMFMAEQLKRWGIRAKRIEQIYNFVTETAPTKKVTGDYFLYVGRLSEEKGLPLLLEAFAGLPSKLKIVGTGPLEKELKHRVETEKMENVAFLGYREGDELSDLVSKSLAVIVPSQWYENCPLVILEAYQHGKPVIATEIGGIPELVHEGQTGYTFKLGSPNDLRKKIQLVTENISRVDEMGQNATAFSDQFLAEKYYQKLITIYESLVGKK